jgi:hypothetical protein
MDFYVGLHQPSDAPRFARSFISVTRLRTRRAFSPQTWIMDSGAFSTILRHGGYPHPPSEYAAQIRRWAFTGTLLAAVTQDYMCEPAMLQRTGLLIRDHQRLTIERFDTLSALLADSCHIYLMPVLQGYSPSEYVDHLELYGDRLAQGAWVGVGSICKRNANPLSILRVLSLILDFRPDLRLHGFGLKITALMSRDIQAMLHSSDSMAWSFRARRNGRNPNDWREAQAMVEAVDRLL